MIWCLGVVFDRSTDLCIMSKAGQIAFKPTSPTNCDLEDGENLLRGNGGRLLLPQRIFGDPRATCRMHFSRQIIFASLKEISSVSFSHKEFPLKLGFTSRR
jgi:hypothetical protein